MEDNDKEKIEKIISGFKCPKDFKCYRSGFDNLCKAKDIGLILCLEKDPQSCAFALSFRDEHFCKCPLRIYIIKTLKK